MLIEFRVENHRSIREEQVLTMEEARLGDESDKRPRKIVGHDKRLLPAAALYGANASGKSNVLSALAFMSHAVRSSHRFWDPEGGVPRSPFAWGEANKQPSMFEVKFVLNKAKYQYGFVSSDEAIEEEWLYAWPEKRRQIWFEREGDRFKFGTNLDGPNDVMKKVTRSNALFLSIASQHKHSQLSSLYAWFTSFYFFNISPFTEADFPTNTIFSDSSHFPLSTSFRAKERARDKDDKNQMLDLLRAADTGIVDVKVTVEEPKQTDRTFIRKRVQFKHQPDDEESWLDLDQESQGTQALFQMAPSVFAALRSGGLFVADELESSIHPLLVSTLLNLFNSKASNPKNAQMIFATHDTNLLGTMIESSPLRRDQIWFTERNPQGESCLYPLTNFRPRNVENLERGYLQGRYGAIPFLGNFAWELE